MRASPRRLANPRYAEAETTVSEYRVYDEVVPYIDGVIYPAWCRVYYLPRSGEPSLSSTSYPRRVEGGLLDRMQRVPRGRECTRDPGDSPHSLVHDTTETRKTTAGAGRAVRLVRNKADGNGRTGPAPAVTRRNAAETVSRQALPEGKTHRSLQAVNTTREAWAPDDAGHTISRRLEVYLLIDLYWIWASISGGELRLRPDESADPNGSQQTRMD